MNRQTAIDLFCGAGGLSLGLRQAGFEVIGAVDLNPFACSVYRLNHRSVKLWEKDLRQLSASEIMSDLRLQKGELSLLAACPPCQGFSTIRTKNGLRNVQDQRNDLIFDVIRLIEGLRPKSVMFENVPGLKKDARYAEFVRRLDELGYHAKAEVLNAADYGVPQKAPSIGAPRFD